MTTSAVSSQNRPAGTRAGTVGVTATVTTGSNTCVPGSRSAASTDVGRVAVATAVATTAHRVQPAEGKPQRPHRQRHGKTRDDQMLL